ncbi:hypothetical protein [Salegentibacter salarius]|uniref:Uncharacterized protein n=1 Tax=Salegentibacter salarius TaxID=435906 RepID=A0A2N0TRE9_9FLAO|nr:hypothetical protein [Salegentibacter salarius]OEY71954.1 hypothetical protein BHS39_14640 [Salegentibacter salarius]PKD17310.1 hypothetical protein APR40_14610 [Salegentibacter salarius]SLK05533.1 hypothetical protein SAMN05660445_03011 [Salegentibacter salarius]
MKAVNYSWWIGAIISTVLTLTLTGGSAKDNPAMLILIGIFNGVFWGWMIGFIFDKLNEKKDAAKFATKEVKEDNIKAASRNIEAVSTIKKSSENVEYYRALLDYTKRNNPTKEYLTEMYQGTMNKYVAEYIRKNPNITRDPLMGPMKLINYINVASEELKKALLNDKEKFAITDEDAEEIIKKVHKTTINKTLK